MLRYKRPYIYLLDPVKKSKEMGMPHGRKTGVEVRGLISMYLLISLDPVKKSNEMGCDCFVWWAKIITKETGSG